MSCKSERRRPFGWTAVSALCAALGVASSTGACRSRNTEPEKPAAEPRQVRLVAVAEQTIERSIVVSGTLAADEQVTAAVKVPGRVASIAIDLASRVTQGDTIASIDPTDYRLRVEQIAAAVSQARVLLGLPPDGTDDTIDPEATAIVRRAAATLEEARTARERNETLARDGLTSTAELESAKAAYLRAETEVQSAREEVRLRGAALRQRRSELRLAQQQLSDTVIKAPITGVVQARRTNTGEYLLAGAPVADIVRIDPLRLRLVIPEREAQAVAAGQSVRVEVEGDKQAYLGVIARLSPSLDQDNRTLLVEADIRNPGTLRPGVMARARIVAGSKPAPTVPTSAVVVFAGIEKVLGVEGGKAIERRVTTGQRSGEMVEILSGVKVGDKVVSKPGSLQQGQPVRVTEGG